MTAATAAASLLLFAGLWLIGRRSRWGFVFSAAGEVIWTAEAARREMWDLAAVCAVFAITAATNFRAWSRPTASPPA